MSNFSTAELKAIKGDILILKNGKATIEDNLKLGQIDDVESTILDLAENVANNADSIAAHNTAFGELNSSISTISGKVNTLEETVENLSVSSGVTSVTVDNQQLTGNVKLYDARGLDTTDNDLWATTIETDTDGNIIFKQAYDADITFENHFSDEVKSIIYDIKGTKVTDSSGNLIANIEFNKVVSGYSLFADCGNLHEIDIQLDSCEIATSMFSGTQYVQGPTVKIVNDVLNLPKAKNIAHMFSRKYTLEKIKLNAPLCVYAKEAFYYINGLQSASINIPSCKNTELMFENDYSLTTFDGILDSLSSAYAMFNGCSGLTSFTAMLPALSNGRYMFNKCKLDLNSLICIASTLPTWTDEGHVITIGLGITAEEAAPWISKIEDKGWVVEATYATNAAAILDLDAEPIVWYCSVETKLSDDEIAAIEAKGEKAYQSNHWEWQTQDGTKANLHMFNYVTDPENYFMCYSQAEALEHFGLFPKENN